MCIRDSSYEYPTTPYSEFKPREVVQNQVAQIAAEAEKLGSATRDAASDMKNNLVDSVSKKFGNMVDSTKNAVGNAVDEAKSTASSFSGALQPAVTKPGSTSFGGSDGLQLNLQGQGSYAPGSVRRPGEFNPNDLVLPTSDFNSAGSGSR